ncbi:hypothetical protein SAMN05192529_10793 [Arachidicoccus rhizosphaerae]|jgi:hypothetical protein|uniref:Uncharacterized protein n=1 Tax=Arachidicoccus rhizosphaerae TaxID=551991 RepID=A0A1H3Y420_9BACT|nr:hypothetical protein [Arachidicoccus rhizosphaerae]SEA06366.1 hypothetical protein SAMN05192529_10793 [Arachidicoccus rhizosphaerae]
MDLPLEGLQVKSFTSVLQGSNKEDRTALKLLKQIQGVAEATTPENTNKKMIELVIDEKENTMIVSGASGPVKVFSHARKLLLIQTAKDNQAHFKISQLKKGRYFLEAEHQFFEFVR